MPIETPKKSEKQIEAITRRRVALLRQIAKVGPVLQGSIAPRTIVCDDPDTPGKKKECGPYHQWTWKRDGKTVTVNLSEAQAVRYQKALDENKKLESLLQQLRTASLELLEATTQGVPKRAKRREQ